VAEAGPDVDPLRSAEKATSRSAPIASKARGLANAGQAKQNTRGGENDAAVEPARALQCLSKRSLMSGRGGDRRPGAAGVGPSF